MRADRLISILMQLQVRRRITARELAGMLEVSERTIHRDMEALSMAGIPVLAERGAGGGWSLVEGYRTNLTGLNREEIQALFVNRPSRLLSDLGLEKASNAALMKLLASLPSANRDEAEYARQRIHVDMAGWHHDPESFHFLQLIQEAVWRERKLRFSYQRGGGCDPVERVADPLGLVAKGSVWYLVAGIDGDIRSYRVSRMLDAELIDEPCVRPEEFDLADYWQRSAIEFKDKLPKYYATFRVEPGIVPLMPYAGRFARVEKVGQPGEDGRVEVSMRFQFEEEACEYALGFGARAEVVDPPSLREKVRAAAQEVIEFYDRDPRVTKAANQS
jgi:predicted DNA-binding transcriptional regulator YafY